MNHDDENDGTAAGIMLLLAAQGLMWLLIGLGSGYLLWGPV